MPSQGSKGGAKPKKQKNKAKQVKKPTEAKKKPQKKDKKPKAKPRAPRTVTPPTEKPAVASAVAPAAASAVTVKKKSTRLQHPVGLVVFGRDNCPYTDMALEALASSGLPFKYRRWNGSTPKDKFLAPARPYTAKDTFPVIVFVHPKGKKKHKSEQHKTRYDTWDETARFVRDIAKVQRNYKVAI